MMTMPVAEFVRQWRNSPLTEAAGSQSHFNDVCRVVGHPTPSEIDTRGEFFAFEKRAAKMDGGQGWADVWYRHHFAWEYKKDEADLDAAFSQVQNYGGFRES